MTRGIRVLEEQPGSGATAKSSDFVTFDLEIALSQGDIVTQRQEFTTRLGSRQLIAGVEKAIMGMQEGGYRKVKVSPHLAYGDAGVPGTIPSNALLVCQVWLKRVSKTHT